MHLLRSLRYFVCKWKLKFGREEGIVCMKKLIGSVDSTSQVNNKMINDCAMLIERRRYLESRFL